MCEFFNNLKNGWIENNLYFFQFITLNQTLKKVYVWLIVSQNWFWINNLHWQLINQTKPKFPLFSQPPQTYVDEFKLIRQINTVKSNFTSSNEKIMIVNLELSDLELSTL